MSNYIKRQLAEQSVPEDSLARMEAFLPHIDAFLEKATEMGMLVDVAYLDPVINSEGGQCAGVTGNHEEPAVMNQAVFCLVGRLGMMGYTPALGGPIPKSRN